MLAENEQSLLAHDSAARRRLMGGVFCAPAKAPCAPRDAGGSPPVAHGSRITPSIGASRTADLTIAAARVASNRGISGVLGRCSPDTHPKLAGPPSAGVAGES